MDVKLNGRTLVAAMVAACGLVGGLRANGRSASAAGPAAAKVLHFPRDQYLGSLYIEDPCLGSSYTEQGHDLSLPYGLDPKRLALDDDWEGGPR